MLSAEEYDKIIEKQKEKKDERKNKWIAEIEDQFGKELLCPKCNKPFWHIFEYKLIFEKVLNLSCGSTRNHSPVEMKFKKAFGKWKMQVGKDAKNMTSTGKLLWIFWAIVSIYCLIWLFFLI